MSEGSPTEKGLRLDAQVLFKGHFTGTALVIMRQQWRELSRYLPTNFSHVQTLDGTGLYQEAPGDFRDKVDRIRAVDWGRSVDRYCCQERGQVLRIDHRKHLPQSCKSLPTHSTLCKLCIMAFAWSAIRGRMWTLLLFFV